MNPRRFLAPAAVLAAAVALMGAYYALFYRASSEAADFAAILGSAEGLASQQIVPPRVDTAVPDERATRAVRVVVDTDLLLVDAAAPLALKVQLSGKALRPRDSQHFIEHADTLDIATEQLAAMVARQFANVDTLKLDGRDAPPIRLANLTVDADVPPTRAASVVQAVRLAGAQTVFFTVLGPAGVAHLEWDASRDGELEGSGALATILSTAP